VSQEDSSPERPLRGPRPRHKFSDAFQPMAEDPDSEGDSGSVPWRRFSQMCKSVIALWIASICIIGLDEKYYDSPKAPRESPSSSALKPVQVVWPHKYFLPSALSCSRSGDAILLADQFSLYVLEAHRASNQSVLVNTRPRLAASTIEIGMPWKGMDVLQGKSRHGSFRDHHALFFIDSGGRMIWERRLRSGSLSAKAQAWTLGSVLDADIEAIQLVEGKDADACSSSGSNFINLGWALYAATDTGQVFILCPGHGHVLHPLYVLASFRRRKTTQQVIEVVDSHTGDVKVSRTKIIGLHVDSTAGQMWLLVSSTQGIAELQAWDMQSGLAAGAWVLPSGRQWAPGLCSLGGRMLLAANVAIKVTAEPELWELAGRSSGLRGAVRPFHLR